MKRILLLSLVLLFCACKKKGHELRIVNTFGSEITNVAVGPVVYGNVEPGGKTSYKPLPAGEHVITGTWKNGFLSGKINLTGDGNRLWTLSVNEDATITLTFDN